MHYATDTRPGGARVLHAFESRSDRDRFVDNRPGYRESVPGARAAGAYARTGTGRVILHELSTLDPRPPIEYRHGFTVWILPDVWESVRASRGSLARAIRESLDPGPRADDPGRPALVAALQRPRTMPPYL